MDAKKRHTFCLRKSCAVCRARLKPVLCAMNHDNSRTPMNILVKPYTPEHLDALVPMWRASFEQGVGVTDPNPLEEQRAYFLEQVLPRNEVRVALQGDELVGFVAASSSEIDQLYVHPDHQGRGIGSKLLRWAQENSDGRLTLFTFARNQMARTFYGHKGFTVIARGFEEQWQLDDLQYEWRSR